MPRRDATLRPETTADSQTGHRGLTGRTAPHRRRRRTRRILASEGVFDALVSLAGLTGRPVVNQSGQEIGTLVDVVARWHDGQTYPPVTGLVVRVGRRLAFVDAGSIDRMDNAQVVLRTARLDLRDFTRRSDEVMLVQDVLDHQLVDVDGVQVIRAADLYLAEVLGRVRLVGADVSNATLLRRLGPRRWRPQPTPDRVIDWAAIQPFGDTAQGLPQVRLRTSHEGLHRLRPGELADLLEDLRRDERHELLAALTPEEAADALEEMDAVQLKKLLNDVEPETGAVLVAAMEPDEAVDALRDLPTDKREAFLALMAPDAATALLALLDYPEDRAGGFMTTRLVVAETGESATEVADRLADLREHEVDIDAVAVVDRDGRVVGDLTLLDLLLALRQNPDVRIGALIDDDDVVTVSPDASAREVAKQLVEARRLSVLVVEDDRPIGRILADDVLDALVPTSGRFHFPRLLT